MTMQSPLTISATVPVNLSLQQVGAKTEAEGLCSFCQVQLRTRTKRQPQVLLHRVRVTHKPEHPKHVCLG